MPHRIKNQQKSEIRSKLHRICLKIVKISSNDNLINRTAHVASYERVVPWLLRLSGRRLNTSVFSELKHEHRFAVAGKSDTHHVWIGDDDEFGRANFCFWSGHCTKWILKYGKIIKNMQYFRIPENIQTNIYKYNQPSNPKKLGKRNTFENVI